MDSVNLLEWITELRKPMYSPGHQFMIKGYNSETAIFKTCIEQEMRKRQGAAMQSPGAPLSPNLHKFANPETLQTPSFGAL